MSILTALPSSWYCDDAFKEFSEALPFARGTARAAMWLSQLAYEDASSDKARAIARTWGLEAVPMERPAARDTGRSWLARLLDLEPQIFLKEDALLVVLPGTDPLQLAHLITDLNVLVRNDLHDGFRFAVEAIWKPLRRAIEREMSGHPRRRLVFAGHSLGAALAVVAADKAHQAGKDVHAVYAFGMPQAGNAVFAEGYNTRLGRRTCRFVLGGDIVPTLPGSLLGYRHVGIFLPSDGARFGAAAFPAPPDVADRQSWSNDPAWRIEDYRKFVAELLRVDVLGKLADPSKVLGLLRDSPDDRAVRIFDFLLRTPLRTHLPISYCRAFSAD